MGNYIKHALQSMDNDISRVACGLISDLSGTMMEKMNEYLDDFVPCIHAILQSNTIDRNVKLPALHALADLALNQDIMSNQQYLKESLAILSMAAQMSVQTVE
jgi:hypothetical protein